MGGVPHVEGVNNELYANVTVKRRQPKEKLVLNHSANEDDDKVANDVNSIESEDKDENLPSGWEKHEGKLRAFIQSR